MTTTSTSRTRSPITIASSESQQQLGPLEPPHDRGGEAGAVRTVGDAVVERERHRQQQAWLDPSVAHDGLLAGPGNAENRDLRVVDDRDGAGAAERTDVGDRERPAAQVVERGLAVAHALGKRPELARDLHHRL